MTERDNIAQAPAESDKQSEVKKPTEKPQVDVLDLMEESAEQAKVLAEDYADGKLRFTVGDGGFGIDDPESLKLQAPADKPAEGPTVTPSVEKDGDTVKSTTFANGQKLDFKYGADGRLSEMDSSTGDKWKRQGDGSWKAWDKDGKEIPTDHIEDVHVGPDGSIVTYRKDGSYMRENTDLSTDTTVKGRQIFDKPDGSSQEVHDNGILVSRTETGEIKVEPKPWGPDADGWKEEIHDKDHPSQRDDPPGTKYYKFPDPDLKDRDDNPRYPEEKYPSQDLKVYPDGSYHQRGMGQDGLHHDIRYNSKTGEITDTVEPSSTERVTVTRDIDGKESRTRSVKDEKTGRWEQVDPPPPPPTTPQ